MIKKSIPAVDLIGRKVKLDRDICNGAGDGIGINGIATVTKCVQGGGITIRTDKCSCCNQYSVISHVSRSDLSLVEE